MTHHFSDLKTVTEDHKSSSIVRANSISHALRHLALKARSSFVWVMFMWRSLKAGS